MTLIFNFSLLHKDRNMLRSFVLTIYLTILVGLLQLVHAAPLAKRTCPPGTQPAPPPNCTPGSTDPLCAAPPPPPQNDPKLSLPDLSCVPIPPPPGLPAIPGAPIPAAPVIMPITPPVPAAPVVPPLPGLPTLPTLPDLSGVAAPNLAAVAPPALPQLPALTIPLASD